MSSTRRLLLSLAVLAAVAGAACGDPPDKEMQQAQGAIDAARAAGADQYARDEFAAAEDALKRSHDAVAQRDYRQALNTALDARERAQAAAKERSTRKRPPAPTRPRRWPTPMPRCTTRAPSSRTAETARAPARILTGARKAIDNGETAVQEARTAFDKGDYLGAIETGRAIRARPEGRQRTISTAAAARRRAPAALKKLIAR